MQWLRTSLERNKYLFFFILIIFLFGICSGLLFYFKQDNALKESLALSIAPVFQEKVFPLENIFYHFIFLFFILLSLFIFIGIPLFVFYIFLEGISLGFIVPLFFSVFKINGILYFLLYFLLIKFLYYFFLFFLFVKACRFISSYVSSLQKKNYTCIKNFTYLLFLLFFLVLNDFGIYFGSNRILMLLLS